MIDEIYKAITYSKKLVDINFTLTVYFILLLVVLLFIFFSDKIENMILNSFNIRKKETFLLIAFLLKNILFIGLATVSVIVLLPGKILISKNIYDIFIISSAFLTIVSFIYVLLLNIKLDIYKNRISFLLLISSLLFIIGIIIN